MRRTVRCIRNTGQSFGTFDSLLVGLTATPRDQVDRTHTYELFDLEPGVPTDAYELATAVADGYLVPPKVQQVDLRFPREGIDYDSLSAEEQAQWESLDWGDGEDGGGLPERVNASAINSWLFNSDTVDKVLQHLMEHGHTVDGGDRLAKTIIFARAITSMRGSCRGAVQSPLPAARRAFCPHHRQLRQVSSEPAR